MAMSADVRSLAIDLDRHDVAPVRDRRKIARALAHRALALARPAGLTAEDIDVLVRALDAGARVHSRPQSYLAEQAKLMGRRRELTDGRDPVTADEAAVAVDIEWGSIVVADATGPLSEAFFGSDGPEFVAAMNRGAFFSVATGFDGAVRVRLRMLESGPLEPMAAEFERVTGATATGRLEADSGAVVLHGGGQVGLCVPATDRSLTVRAYQLGRRARAQILVVAAPLDGLVPAAIERPPALDLL